MISVKRRRVDSFRRGDAVRVCLCSDEIEYTQPDDDTRLYGLALAAACLSVGLMGEKMAEPGVPRLGCARTTQAARQKQVCQLRRRLLLNDAEDSADTTWNFAKVKTFNDGFGHFLESRMTALIPGNHLWKKRGKSRCSLLVGWSQ